MSAVAVAVALFILAAGVIWGCAVDHLRSREDRAAADAEREDHHRALMREVRRHGDQQPRWRP